MAEKSKAPDPDESRPGRAESSSGEPEWKRRQRLAEIFGDVLPSSTRDDRDPEDSRRSAVRTSEEWLRSQVPPHHGGH